MAMEYLDGRQAMRTAERIGRTDPLAGLLGLLRLTQEIRQQLIDLMTRRLVMVGQRGRQRSLGTIRRLTAAMGATDKAIRKIEQHRKSQP